MAATISDLALLLQNISISSEPKSGLDELKNVLSTLRIDHIDNASGQLNLKVLFDCLNSSNKDQVDTCADVLGKLLSASPAAVNIRQYAVELDRALIHPSSTVRMVVLKQVDRCIADAAALSSLKQNSSLLQNVIDCIGAEAASVAACAVRAVTALGRSSSQAALLLLSPPLLNALTRTMATSDIVRYRVYEVAVNVACLSRDTMKLVEEVGILPQLIGEAFGHDVLVLLNALELLTTLAETDHGFEHLEAEGVTHRLEKMLTAPEDATIADFTLPGLMKFFGRLGHARPAHVLSRYRGFTARLLAMPAEADPCRRTAALDTVVCLVMTAPGKLALHREGAAATECISEIGRLAQNAPTETRVRALQTIYQLLHTQAGEVTAEVLAVTEAWFGSLAPQPLELVWGVARQPFLDLRLAALRVLAAVLALDWGQRLCFQRAGFLEYVLDRSSETTQQGRDAKLALVDAVLSSAGVEQRLQADTLAELTAYQQQGALYVRARTEVALDDSNV